MARHFGNYRNDACEDQELEFDEYDFDYDDDEPGEGCAACGNPAYPNCKSSCPLFDD